MEPDEVDLAAEGRLEPPLGRAGRTGSTENVERATGELASRRWRSGRGVELLAVGPAARWQDGVACRHRLTIVRLNGSAGDRRHGASLASGCQRPIIGRSTLR